MQSLTKYIAEITAATPPLHIILINAAEECYALMDYYLEQLRHQMMSKARFYKFQADRYFKYSEINDLINKRSLFDDLMYFEIHYKSKPAAEGQKELLELIKQADDTIFITITTDRLSKTDLNNTWVKAVNESGGLVFGINANDIPDIIKHQLSRHKQTITRDGSDLLLELNQGNFNQLMQQVKQLSAAYPINHAISTDEVKQLSANNSVYNIYQLSNAYLTGNLITALQILDDLYQKPEDAILLQWLINEDLKKIIRIKARLKQKHVFSQICQELKIWITNADLYRNAEQRLNYNTLINILDNLASLDMIIKGIVPGNIKQQLIYIVNNLCKT